MLVPAQRRDLGAGGKELLERLNDDHSRLEREVTVLRGELMATRDHLVSLSRQNVGLKQKLSSTREAGLILEQDRKQLQALLEDKHRLQEDNYRLEREIGALQELLEYAAEHVLDRMNSNVEEGEVGEKPDHSIDLDIEHSTDPPAIM